MGRKAPRVETALEAFASGSGSRLGESFGFAGYAAEPTFSIQAS